MAKTAEGSTIVDTSLGKVEYIDHGDGPPVLFVHGSPGGCDQGAVMTEFLVARGFRAVSLSRPGYLGTPLTDRVAGTPDQQADLEIALMDKLGIGTSRIMCWSGGGPSSYRLAAKHPDRVTALVTLAALSMRVRLRERHQQHRVQPVDRRRRHLGAQGDGSSHSPKKLVVGMVGIRGRRPHQGTSPRADRAHLERRNQAGVRPEGVRDHLGPSRRPEERPGAVPEARRPRAVRASPRPRCSCTAPPTPTCTPIRARTHSSTCPNAEILRVANGTHLCVWTDPTSDEVQARIIDHLKR